MNSIRLHSNQNRAKNAIIFFWILLGVSIVSIVSYLMQYQLLQQNEITPEQAEDNDTREQLIGIILIITNILAIVFFLMCFRRAYYNLFLLKKKFKHSEQTAIWGWFVPIYNFIVPYEIMRSIWRETYKEAYQTQQAASNPLLGWWWGSYLTSLFVNRISNRLAISANTVDDFQNSTTLNIMAKLISIVALMLVIQVIKRTHQLEQLMHLHQQNKANLTETETPEEEY